MAWTVAQSRSSIVSKRESARHCKRPNKPWAEITLCQHHRQHSRRGITKDLHHGWILRNAQAACRLIQLIKACFSVSVTSALSCNSLRGVLITLEKSPMYRSAGAHSAIIWHDFVPQNQQVCRQHYTPTYVMKVPCHVVSCNLHEHSNLRHAVSHLSPSSASSSPSWQRGVRIICTMLPESESIHQTLTFVQASFRRRSKKWTSGAYRLLLCSYSITPCCICSTTSDSMLLRVPLTCHCENLCRSQARFTLWSNESIIA